MEKDRPMDPADIAAAALVRRTALWAAAPVLAAMLGACAHAPGLSGYRDALSPAEHVRLGTSYEAQGLRAEARDQYKQAVRSDTGCAECWLALGNSEFTDGNMKEAETSFRGALKAAPQHAGAANNLAMALLARNGSLQEAEALAQEALRTAGALRPYVLDTLANVYIRQHRYTEAAAALGQAEAATPPPALAVRRQLEETRKNLAAAELAPPGEPRSKAFQLR